MEPATADRADGLRVHLHDMWAGVAPAWAANAAFIDARGRHLDARLLELAAPTAGERVLELGCGTGGTGLAAAALVGPDGEVVLSDVAEAMVAIAAARAAERGAVNLSTRVLDLEAIAEPDGAYDVVLCREGLMLVVDPVRGAAEIRRVLRPGGRVALSVWGPRARNPWLGIVFDAASAALGAPVPPPGLPQPFSLDDAGRLAAVLEQAGLVDVAVEELELPYRCASTDEWWQRTCALAGPLAARLAALPDAAAQALRARAEAAARPYATPAGLEFPGVVLVASATRG